MPPTDLALREATDGDLDRVVSLLDAAGLPTAGVRDDPVTMYLASRAGADDAAPVAAGGVESTDGAVLLRSVVVAPGGRGTGVGSALVSALESRVAAGGTRDCYLLTTDAAGFFGSLGYERLDRADVPDGVRRTRQFETVCPDTATAMHKRLPEPST